MSMWQVSYFDTKAKSWQINTANPIHYLAECFELHIEKLIRYGVTHVVLMVSVGKLFVLLACP